MSAPGTINATRQPSERSMPNDSRAANSSGMTACVAPPPALPQPAAVALAVPTTFGANMIGGVKLSDDERRADRADAQSPEQKRLVALREGDRDHWNRAEGEQPRVGEARPIAVAQGPDQQSHQNGDADGRDIDVGDLLRRQAEIVRITGISGATANQAKKHTKNALHVRWNARIGMLLKLRSPNRVARCSMFAAPTIRDDRCKHSATPPISDLQAFFPLFCAALVRAHSYRSPKLVRLGAPVPGTGRGTGRFARRFDRQREWAVDFGDAGSS